MDSKIFSVKMKPQNFYELNQEQYIVGTIGLTITTKAIKSTKNSTEVNPRTVYIRWQDHKKTILTQPSQSIVYSIINAF